MTMHSDETLYVPGEWLLEELIETVGDHPDGDDRVRMVLTTGTTLLALGEPIADPAGAAHLLHCAVPVDETTIAMLPVFTRIEHVAAAIAMNPAWRSLHVLGIDGAVLLQDLGPGEWLAINPWSGGHEFKLPPEGGPLDDAGHR
jgi:hypothetical protein